MGRNPHIWSHILVLYEQVIENSDKLFTIIKLWLLKQNVIGIGIPKLNNRTTEVYTNRYTHILPSAYNKGYILV